MTKKGFTLMELLVSIFITGMVMLSLVAMWKTSSNHTAQAQRQSIIKNDSTIFLRKLYSDFVFASEVICPWGYQELSNKIFCNNSDEYIALKEAVAYFDGHDVKIKRITSPVCGASNNEWAEGMGAMSHRCVKPSFVIYVYDSAAKMVYRCSSNFLDSTALNEEATTMTKEQVRDAAHNYCANEANREVVMPYVNSFSLSRSPELTVQYEVNRVFGGDIPNVYFRVRHILPLKRGA